MQDCFEYSTRLISKFPKTTQELIIKLRKKGYGEDVIQTTVKKLKQHGYLNDYKFAKMYVESELIKKGKPPFKIKGKLMEKGIEKDTINKIIKKNEPEIEASIEDKIKERIEKYKSKNIKGTRIIQKIGRKGYKFEKIKTVIDKNYDS